MVGENNVEYIHLKGFSRGFNLREGHNQVWFVEALQNISKFIVEVLDSSDGMDPMSVCLVTDGDPMPTFDPEKINFTSLLYLLFFLSVALW